MKVTPHTLIMAEYYERKESPLKKYTFSVMSYILSGR